MCVDGTVISGNWPCLVLDLYGQQGALGGETGSYGF